MHNWTFVAKLNSVYETQLQCARDHIAVVWRLAVNCVDQNFPHVVSSGCQGGGGGPKALARSLRFFFSGQCGIFWQETGIFSTFLVFSFWGHLSKYFLSTFFFTFTYPKSTSCTELEIFLLWPVWNFLTGDRQSVRAGEGRSLPTSNFSHLETFALHCDINTEHIYKYKIKYRHKHKYRCRYKYNTRHDQSKTSLIWKHYTAG